MTIRQMVEAIAKLFSIITSHGNNCQVRERKPGNGDTFTEIGDKLVIVVLRCFI